VMRDFPAAASAGESRSAVRIDDRRYLGIPSASSPELNNSTRWLDFGGALHYRAPVTLSGTVVLTTR
jgi:hypothetical protein